MSKKPFLYSDNELIQLLNAGDQRCFAAIYNAFYKELVYFAFKLIQDSSQAEDLATDAFVKLWHYKVNIKNRAHLKSYLFLSVKHAVIDLLRTKEVKLAYNKSLVSNDTDDNLIELAIIEAELMREIMEQIENLPTQSAAVIRHVLDGKTTEEIASIMNLAPKTVLNHKLSGIKKIRNVLFKKDMLLFILFYKYFFN